MTTPTIPEPSSQQTAERMHAFHDDILRVMEKYGEELAPQLLALVLADVYTGFVAFLQIDRESATALVGRLYDNAQNSHTHHTAH